MKQHLVDAYYRMLGRLKTALEDAEHKAAPVVERAIERAQETATELGELTREEAERVGGYLRRDLEDAARFLADTGSELGEWLRFDLQLVEKGLADLFRGSVDYTRVELGQLAERADAVGEWHSGEITGIGTLQCKACGEKLHFHHIGHIPPCPKCHGTVYRRVSRDDT
ncbi:zinc ribbon-containing protein [Sulfurivermis fontis]|uniref:zinc ribbon-containing protein n=1 Tax=Sulfurivermis fontis TaxID=1972068 RepID=UPI001E4D9CE5|nr:zinc ribbon-containing protein [Sulfurivermis fontis]